MKMNDQSPSPRSHDATGEENGLGLEVLERMTRPVQRTVPSLPDTSDPSPGADTGRVSLRGHDGVRLAGPDGHPQPEDEVAPANIDRLTGLANRQLLLNRLDQALQRRHTLGGHVVVFHVELNNLSYVDDQLGTPAANAILQEISHRLLSLLRSEDTVSRVGHSELVVAVSLQGEGPIGLLEARIEAAFESKIALADREVHMWVTLHSVEAQTAESAEALLKRLEQMTRLESSGTSRAWSLTLGAR
jgi:diguanylate cyclase (GGDEF)-like protein